MSEETGFEDFCALSPEQLRERSLSLRRDLMPLVKRASRLPDDAGLALDFDASPERRRQLDELVAFERQCCSGLDWDVTERAASSSLRLTIAGLAPDAGMYQTLGLAPAVQPGEQSDVQPDLQPDEQSGEQSGEPARGGISRLAKAGGLGVGSAFFLFCVVPIGIAAAGGGALAAWLSPLDHPVVVLLGGAALGFPLWRYLHRKQAATTGS